MSQFQHFLDAQQTVWPQVVEELALGQKQTHWMWFVFPQLSGLGHSRLAKRYGLTSVEHAKAYLQSADLAQRLTQATQLVLLHKDKPLKQIFSTPDNLKFISSMTLFSLASEMPDNVYSQALQVFNQGCLDENTVRLITS